MRMTIPTFLAVALLSGTAGAAPRPMVVAYVPNWIDLPAFAETIDFAKVTHLNLAFENPVDAEGNLSFHEGNRALLAKAAAHAVKIFVSIGGGAASTDAKLKARYFHLLSEPQRAAFVARLTEYVVAHGFDGLDVDIEGPSINEDYGAFIAALAPALRAHGKQLTAALSQGYGGDRVPDEVFAALDFLNIMAYDGAGYWAPERPGPHSSLRFAKDNLAYWLGRGLPKAKAVLGVPFYGYGFGEAFRKRDYPYKNIVDDFPGSEVADEAGRTIYYNGKPTIRAKCELALDQKLGGIMIWSLDSDASGEASLLGVIHETLSRATKD